MWNKTFWTKRFGTNVWNKTDSMVDKTNDTVNFLIDFRLRLVQVVCFIGSQICLPYLDFGKCSTPWKPKISQELSLVSRGKARQLKFTI